MRLWTGLAIIAICAGTNFAQSIDYEWYGLDDSNFQSKEYDYKFSAENKKDSINLVKKQPDDGKVNSEEVNEDVENFYKSLENVKHNQDSSVLNDYQFEDNRSEPKDENEDTLYADDDERLSDKDLGPKENPDDDGLAEEMDTDYYNPSDTKQFNDDNIYETDENSAVEPIDKEHQITLFKGIPDAEDTNEYKPLDTVDDILNKMFDDAEDVKRIHENIDSIEQTNQLIKDLAGDIAGSKNENQDNVRNDQSEDIQKEADSEEHEVKPINSRKNFDQSHHDIKQDIDNEKSAEKIIETYENDEDLPSDEDEPYIEESEVQEPFIESEGQNEDTNSKGQIIEENINNESRSNEDENEEISNDFDGNQNANDDTEKNKDEIENQDDTVAKAYADLNDDINNLFETWDKLQEDDTVEVDDTGNILDYEEKYNKPYRENNILSVREYDDEIDGIDDNLEDDEEENIMNSDDETDEQKHDNEVDSVLPAILVTEKTKVSDESFYRNVSSITREGFVDNDESFYRNGSSFVQEKDAMENNDEIDNTNHDSEDDVSTGDSSKTQENEDHKTAEVSTIEDEIENTLEMSTEYNKEENTIKTIDVDDLTPGQYKDLMKQFSIVHSEDLKIKSGDHVAPIHITLSADDAVVIESPDYPENYPTNNVIDYYFDGLGTGIEFNITDFSVNGILGDYLLVKPGGVDASSADGLVFSYHLNGKRKYRFLNVDRLFVRFFAHPGIAMFKGYQFSVKMISPPEEEDSQPEPEPLLPPLDTYTVTLGGTSLGDFADIQEDFRLLVADMATMFINANNIDVGLNSTSEITQITDTSLCNVNWPSYESCVAVTFGVPLQSDDDQPARLNETDLRTMWDTYVGRDPFATRLRMMGITEFDSPNDRRVLTVWLVIAGGVLISVAMLAFALWRFSCFEDYTRMAPYSDTDSINEKRVLDMYPTPHQTFPALYSEQQLKWDDEKFDDTTRVDMGGYANRSYMRDETMDMDSDEDIMTTPRDRNSFSPRDIYQV